MTKNLKEIVLQQIYDILVGKENEIDKLKVLITLLQTLNGDELVNGSEKTILTSNNNSVLSGLKRNKEKYGKRYCSLERTDDTVYMCKEFREMDKGICHCQ